MAPLRRQRRMRNNWDVSNSLWSVTELWEWGWAVVLGLCVVSLCIMSMTKSWGQNKKVVSVQKKKGTSNYAKGGVSKNKATKSKAQSPRATTNSELSKASSSYNAKGKRKVWESREKLHSRHVQLEKKVEECITLQKRNSMELNLKRKWKSASLYRKGTRWSFMTVQLALLLVLLVGLETTVHDWVASDYAYLWSCSVLLLDGYQTMVICLG